MSGSILKHVLASCRRVLLLLLLAASLFTAWIYWQAPELNSVRPGIEHYLKQNLDLEELQLGKLSWYWAGSLWIQVGHLNFTNRDETLAFHGGDAAVSIPLIGLLTGHITPDRIRLNGGKLDISFDRFDTPAPTGQLLLDNVQVNWRYGSWQGALAHVRLTLDSGERRLKIVSSSVSLAGSLDKDGLLRKLNLQCRHTQWLPEALRKRLHGGAPQASLELQRSGRRSWHANFSLTSATPMSITPLSGHSYALNKLEAGLDITTGESAVMQPERIDIKQMHWLLGANKITANGKWAQGMLSLQAKSAHLDMPLIWNWLQGLGNKQWRHWLASMHSGYASHATGSLDLAWARPFRQWPSEQSWQGMRYHLQANVEDADIALGISKNYLLHTRGRIDLNQDGMRAMILAAELPGQLGSSSGELYIPWHTMILHITGKARPGMGQLLRWFKPDAVADLQWHKSLAEGTFKLVWNPARSAPEQASAVLHPYGAWHISWHGRNFNVAAGKINWKKSTGLTLSRIVVSGKHMTALLSLTAAPATVSGTVRKQWRLKTLNAQIHGQLSQLASSFQIPISNVDGSISSTLHFDGHWSGLLDMQQAGWQHLLGSSKKIGEPFSLHYQGQLKTVGGVPTIGLSKLQSQGNVLKLYGGSISINRNRIKAQLQDMHTPSFSGSLAINVPLNDKPWQVDVHASYLNRNALPASLDHPEQLIDKRWILRAAIDRFDWDAASMFGVRLNLSSKPGSVGEFEATKIQTSHLDIMDVAARITLPGQGRVELRELAARLEKQHMLMSATLSPEATGGMHWSGFAEVEGDFGRLAKLGGLSERFLGGQDHILFSGQGIILQKQPWWQGLNGRLRLRVDNGRILEGGTLTTLLAAINLSKLPALLLGKRDDLTGPGIKYERLQMEAIMQNQDIHIRNVVMRSTAFDLVGHGKMNIKRDTIDLYLIARPLQNIDALLARIPLLRDILGGSAHSLMRKVYHMYGPFTNAKVEAVKPEQAGLASGGLIERMLALPNEWFGSASKPATTHK